MPRCCIDVHLDAGYVIPVQGDVLLVAPVEWSHEGTPHVGVGEPEAVTQLMGGCHEEAGAPGRVHSPVLVIIKVNISSVNREEGMG